MALLVLEKHTDSGGRRKGRWDIPWERVLELAEKADQMNKYVSDGTPRKRPFRDRKQNGRFARVRKIQFEDSEDGEDYDYHCDNASSDSGEYMEQIEDCYEDIETLFCRMVRPGGGRTNSDIKRSFKKIARALMKGEDTTLSLEEMIATGRIASVLCRSRDEPKYAEFVRLAICMFYSCNPQGCHPKNGRPCTLTHKLRSEEQCEFDKEGTVCPYAASCPKSHASGIYDCYVLRRGRDGKTYLRKFQIYDRVTPSSPFYAK